MKNWYLLILVMSISMIRCSDDVPEETIGKYEKGVFIVNQGNFGSGTGTITFYDRDTLIEQKSFQKNNRGKSLGNVAQAMIESSNNYFVSINNAGKAQIIRNSDFADAGKVEIIDQPRYFYNDNNRFLYMTSWGIDGVSGAIHKINPNDGSIVNTLSTLGGPERMAAVGRSLFVAKSGGFGRDSLLLEYDMNNDEIINSTVIGHNPIGVEVDKAGTLWVLCSGFADFTNPANSTAGAIVQFDNNNIINTFSLSNGAGNLVMDSNEDILYFTMDGNIMKFDMKAAGPAEVFYPGFFYALAVDPTNGDLYAADAKDFSSNGEVLIINSNGSLDKKIQAGIIPGFIYFR